MFGLLPTFSKFTTKFAFWPEGVNILRTTLKLQLSKLFSAQESSLFCKGMHLSFFSAPKIKFHAQSKKNDVLILTIEPIWSYGTILSQMILDQNLTTTINFWTHL